MGRTHLVSDSIDPPGFLNLLNGAMPVQCPRRSSSRPDFGFLAFAFSYLPPVVSGHFFQLFSGAIYMRHDHGAFRKAREVVAAALRLIGASSAYKRSGWAGSFWIRSGLVPIR